MSANAARRAALRKATAAPLLSIEDLRDRARPVPRRVSGVYLLLFKNEVVYVGQSVDMRIRVMNHAAGQCGKREFDSVVYIEASVSSLDVLETRYIIKFLPKYNKRRAVKRERKIALAELLG